MEAIKPVKIGETVAFFDSYKVEHAALVTNVFSPTCINVVYVTKDPTRTDSYGNQTERQTSVSHISQHMSEDGKEFFGMCWK